jgi:hypothetical protein
MPHRLLFARRQLLALRGRRDFLELHACDLLTTNTMPPLTSRWHVERKRLEPMSIQRPRAVVEANVVFRDAALIYPRGL